MAQGKYALQKNLAALAERLEDEVAQLRAGHHFHRSEIDRIRGYTDGLGERVRTLLETHENLLATIQRYAQLAEQLNKNYTKATLATGEAKANAEDAKKLALEPIPYWGLIGWRRRLVKYIFDPFDRWA